MYIILRTYCLSYRCVNFKELFTEREEKLQQILQRGLLTTLKWFRDRNYPDFFGTTHSSETNKMGISFDSDSEHWIIPHHHSIPRKSRYFQGIETFHCIIAKSDDEVQPEN